MNRVAMHRDCRIVAAPAARSFCAAVSATLFVSIATVDALQLRSYSAARHDRYTGFPSSPVASTTFIHKDVDLTGVGWLSGETQPRLVTLVSPKFFVGARHYRPAIGSQLRFTASDGTVRTYMVHGYHDILNDDSAEDGGPKPTDLSLGELVEPVAPADGIGFQPYLNLPTEGSYLAGPSNRLIVLGKSFRGGVGTTSAINDFFGDPITSGSGSNRTRSLQFVYQSLSGSIDDAYAESGDSGSPSLVDVNGRAALVGIHTAVVALPGITTTIDSFVAHPPYISQMNAIMASEGYHMTEVNPAALSLAFTTVLPGTIRAGYEVILEFELTNTDGADDANNLKMNYVLPDGVTGVAPSGTGWIAEINGTSIAARMGGLGASEASSLATAATFPAPGAYDLAVAYSADEAPETAVLVPIEVIESYRSWSVGLADPAPDADIDHDGFVNLLEYALGGNAERASAFQPDGVTRMAPGIALAPAENQIEIQFLRRTDALQRGITYDLERSASLQAGDWTDAGPGVLHAATETISNAFERVTMTLDAPPGQMFFRIAVGLSEE